MAYQMRIGRLAELANVNVETIRYYQRRRLLDAPEKPLRGQRCYPESALKRVLFIKKAQTVGFSLEEIENLLRFNPGTDCMSVHQLLQNKIGIIAQRLADLSKMSESLQAFLCNCDGNGCSGVCPVLAALQAKPEMQTLCAS